jgi:hypothetical protein
MFSSTNARRLMLACGFAVALAANGAPAGADDATTPAQTPDQIFAAQKALATAATSMHVVGHAGSQRFDITYARGKGATGKIVQGRTAVRLVALGSVIYLQGNDAFNRKNVGASTVRQLHHRWLKISLHSRGAASVRPLVNMRVLLADIETPTGTLSAGPAVTVFGQQAVPITDQGGDTYDIAATGQPYLLQGFGGDAKFVFDRWNEPVQLKAPSHAIDTTKLKG